MERWIRTLTLAALLSSGLSGCTALVAGSAVAAGGVLSAVDRRSTGAQADDQIMALRIKETALKRLHELYHGAPPASLAVVSYNRHVLLLGVVANERDKALVGDVAREEKAAVHVYNDIAVTPQNRTLGERLSDSWVTSKVRTLLLNAPGLAPNHVKVVTYNGTAYVMGLLTPAEQQVATNAVRTTQGVARVVTLYQTFTPLQ